MIQAALIALIAFLAYMGDALGYSQYDRPLCTGVLVGIALNDVQQGLMVGASLELVYMGTLTIGGAFPPDIYTGGILGTAFAITTGSGIEGAVALSLPIATFALLIKQVIYTFVRGFFVHRADSYALQGNDSKVAAMHVWSTLAYCVPMAIVVGICFYVGGPAVQAVLDQIPAFIMKGLSAASGMLPAQYALLEALQRTDQELLKQLLDYPQFQEQFFRNAEDTPVTRFIKNLLHP